MKKKNFRFFLLFLLFFLALFHSWAQTQTQPEEKDPNMISTQFDTTGLPQWAKDLRRAEIVAFGSFPFAYFFTNFGFDTYRSATHGWDTRYAPWPFKSSGAVEQTQDEKLRTLGIAAGGAVLIALIDYTIVRYKRHQEEREIRNLPPGTPIIIRKPLNEEKKEDGGTETPDPVESSQTEAENP